MSRLENELRSALRREEPSPDFTDRVMAAVTALPAENAKRKKREKNYWRSRIDAFLEPFQIKWALVAATALLALFAGMSLNRHYENQRIQAEGERARQQVLMAMKLTSEKLNYAQRKVQQTVESRN